MMFNFDIIGISDTKEQISDFLKNVSMNGCDLHSQYTSSAAGGVALYIKSNLDYIIREDLSILDDDFGTIWVEIKTKRVKTYYVVVNTDVLNTETLKLKNLTNILTRL